MMSLFTRGDGQKSDYGYNARSQEDGPFFRLKCIVTASQGLEKSHSANGSAVAKIFVWHPLVMLLLADLAGMV